MMRTWVVSSFVAVAALAAADWPQFRGPNGTGIAADGQTAPVEFGPGKNELWKAPVPPGLSSPCVVGDRIFLSACDDAAKKLETLCISRSDGRVLWRAAVTSDDLEPVHKTNSHACATPACDGERVYVYFGSYGLVAYTVDGAKAWELRLPVPVVMFGSGTSPVVAGNFVILNRQQTLTSFPGQMPPKPKEGTEPAASEVLAVDRRTGVIAWRTPAAKTFGGSGYSTPAVGRDGSDDVVIVSGGTKVTALDLKTGQPRWWLSQLPMVTTASPVVAGDRLYLNYTGMLGDIDRVEPVPFDEALKKWDKNGDGKLQKNEIPDELAVFTRRRSDHEGDFGLKMWFFDRADANHDKALDRDEWESIWGKTADGWLAMMKPALLAVKLGGSDDVADSHVQWRVPRGVPEVPSLLVLGKRVYAVRNGGIVICLDADTGKTVFEERLGTSDSYYASPVTDGRHVFFASVSGVVTVLKAGDAFERLAINDLGEPVSATPAIVAGRLYVRTGKHLYAFGAK